MNDFINNAKDFWNWLTTGLNDVTDSAGSMLSGFEKASSYYTLVVRWIFPILATAILLRVFATHKKNKSKKCGYLDLR